MKGWNGQERIQQALQLAEEKGMQVAQPRVSDLHFYNPIAWDSAISLKILVVSEMKNIWNYSSNWGPQNSHKWE